jgi:hypothetical protein
MAVSIGFLFLLWVASGAIMVMPQVNVDTLAPDRPMFQPHALRDLRISPADAIKTVNGLSQEPVDVTNIHLRPLAGTMVYEIFTGDGGAHLIDAHTGAVVTVTEQMAQTIAHAMMVDGVNVESSTLVNAYGGGYTSGPLPVYRIQMSDPSASVVYVSARNGDSRYTNRWIRIRAGLEGLHSFDPIEWVTGSSLLRKGLLLLAGLIGGVVALTGYALVFRRV